MVYIKRKYIFGVLASILVTGMCMMPKVLEDGEKLDKDRKIDNKYEDVVKSDKSVGTLSPLTAIVCSDNTYSDGQQLTTDGLSFKDWQYDTVKYLKIDINTNVCSCGGKSSTHAGHVVTIKLPKELYFCDINIGDVVAPDGFRDYKYTANNETIYIKGTTTEKLKINANSGTMKYYLNDDAEIKEATVYVAVKYDRLLWDKQAGSAITKVGVSPIEVTLSSMSEYSIATATETEVSTIKMSEAYAKDGMGVKNGTLWDAQQPDGSRRVQCFIYSGVSFGFDSYYDEGTVTFTLPYYEENGVRYYLEYIDDEATNPIDYTNLYNSNSTYDLRYDRDNGTLTYTVKGFYFYSAYASLDTRLKIPDELETENKNIVFKNGTVNITVKSSTGNTYTIMNQYMTNSTYTTVIEENVYFTGVTNRYVADDKSKDGALFMGGFYTANSGLKDSEKKTFTFEFPDELLITTLNMPSNRIDNTINVKYTMKDEQGNDVYFDKTTGAVVASTSSNATNTWTIPVSNNTTSNNKDDANAMISRQNLTIESHKRYYFKTISYTITTIQASAMLYAVWSEGNPNGTGNYYGYLREDATVGSKYMSRCTIVSENSGTIGTLVSDRYTTIDKNNSVSYDIWNVKVSKSSILAGEDFTISGNLCVSGYPYGNNQKIKDITIGLLLEDGITFTSDELELMMGTTKLEPKSITVQDTDNGKKLWLIKVGSDVAIGYNSEFASRLANGDSIKFNVKLVTDVNMSYTVMELKNVLFCAAKGQKHAGGIKACVDQYDMNENGETTDHIYYMGSNDTTMWTIVENSKKINITNKIALNGVDGESVISDSKDDIITYTLSIVEQNNATTKKFVYYIPVFKKDTQVDNRLIHSEGEDGFDLDLVGPVEIVGSDYFDIYYTNQTGLSFDKAEDTGDDAWLTADEIDEEMWKDITMIKVVNKNGEELPGKFSTDIKVYLSASTMKNAIEPGQINEWGSRGYYKISVDNSVIGGYSGTKIVAAAVTYDKLVDENIQDGYSKQSDDIARGDYGIDEYDETPNTRDETNVWYWMMVALVSGALAILWRRYMVSE